MAEITDPEQRVPEHKHSFWYYWGGLSLFFFTVMCFSGVLLLMYYRPGPAAYESVRQELAWKNMRGMNLHPSNARLADDTVMAGNVFARNILFYRTPKAEMAFFSSVSASHIVCDSNLVWHAGLAVVSSAVEAAPSSQ